MKVDIPLATWFAADGGDVQTLLVVLVVGGGVMLVVTIFLASLLLARRQQRRELREMLVVLEELRSGRTRRRVDLDSRSSLALLGDAVNRLAQDLTSRFTDTQQLRNQLDAFLDAARDYGVITTNLDWDVRTCSQGASSLVGWTEEDLVGRPANLLFDEASWKDLLPKLARRSLRQRGVETRAVMRGRDGSAFHAQLLVRQLPGPDADGSGYLLVVKDVSAQVRLEEDLRESEDRYRRLVEGLAEGVVILRDGRIVYANAAMAEMLADRPEAVTDRPLRDWLSTPDLLVVEESLRSLSGGDVGRAELRCTLVGGGGEPLAHVRIHAAGIRHEGRAAVLASVVDETAQRRVHDELRLNETRLDAVLEATSDGILVVADRPGGSVVGMTNRAFLETFALSRREVLGAAEGQVLRLLRESGGGRESVAAFLAATTPDPRTEAITLTGPPPRVLELNVAPLTDASGRPLGRVLACRDLTDRRAFERRLEADAEKLQESKKALERSYRELNAVNEDLRLRAEQLDRLNRELKKLDAMKSELLANVSHELQTPLVSIRGYTEMILKERLGSITDEQRKGLTLSLKNIDRLISMIDNLLAFSRADRGAAKLRISTFPLRSVLEESLDLLREQLGAKKITVEREIESPGIEVRADRDRILQVFVNVIGNAVKFNREGGRIGVGVRRGERDHVVVRVQDTGIGIPPEALDRIFDQFYRASGEEEAQAPGSGIGLAIVRNILRLHGCSIRAESKPGEGSTFTFTLPLAGVGEKSPEQAEASSAPGGGPAGGEPDAGGPSGAAKTEQPRLRIIRRDRR